MGKSIGRSAVSGVKPVTSKKRTSNVLPMPIKPSAKRAAKTAKLSPDQEELLNIRSELGLSQHVFAEKIEIGKPRLVSYEQGRTIGIPEAIMLAARALLKNGGRTKGDRYAHMDMPEIIAEWSRDLDVDYDDDVQLSNFIGASPEAISRWKNLETRPEPLLLKQYREIVRDLKSRLEKSSDVAKNVLAIVK
jgi:DNA-binding transcriptional regulator YiaG